MQSDKEQPDNVADAAVLKSRRKAERARDTLLQTAQTLGIILSSAVTISLLSKAR